MCIAAQADNLVFHAAQLPKIYQLVSVIALFSVCTYAYELNIPGHNICLQRKKCFCKYMREFSVLT